MRRAVVVVGLALLAVASARCPNSCSGHGDCGGSDVCSCWANWQGFDCSERTCEYDVAWATDYRQNPHYYAECSGKGICDRSTGLCVCFDGYTGSACRRSVCPNDCSGHGKCRLVSELPDATQAQSIVATSDGDLATPGSAFPYANWDGDKIQACVCDGNFFGPDCSQRYCPMGDDPLTTCSEIGGAGVAGNKQVQSVELRSSGAAFALADGFFNSGESDFVGDLVLHYTDNEGGVWTTSKIAIINDATGDLPAAAASNIEDALEGIPNFKIPSVTVSAGSRGTSPDRYNFLVTFDNQRNAGESQLLSCDPLPLGCQSAGCSPMYRQLRNWAVGGDAGANWDYDDIAYTYDSVAGTTPSVYTTLIDTIVTADSVFDNSNLPGAVDRARAQITITKNVGVASNWGASVTNSTDVYATYRVRWAYDATAFSSSCPSGPQFQACATIPVPTGYDTAQSSFADDQGVGFNHVPIGNGIFLNLPDRMGGLDDQDSTAEDVTIELDFATARCVITETVRSDVAYENIECSGRGVCDHSVGVCTCFEGHYGDHCGLQTILV